MSWRQHEDSDYVLNTSWMSIWLEYHICIWLLLFIWSSLTKYMIKTQSWIKNTIVYKSKILFLKIWTPVVTYISSLAMKLTVKSIFIIKHEAYASNNGTHTLQRSAIYLFPGISYTKVNFSLQERKCFVMVHWCFIIDLDLCFMVRNIFVFEDAATVTLAMIRSASMLESWTLVMTPRWRVFCSPCLETSAPRSTWTPSIVAPRLSVSRLDAIHCSPSVFGK